MQPDGGVSGPAMLEAGMISLTPGPESAINK